MKKVALTGAFGFIGSHLIPALKSSGCDVAATLGPGESAPSHTERVFSADISTGDGIEAALDGVDAVIHLAARNHVLKETATDPLAEYRRVNVEGTRNVIRAASRLGVKLFVHFSSVKAMGEGSDAIYDESFSCAPATPYGISRMESEAVVREEAGRAGTGAVILRLPMVYGPGNKGNFPRIVSWAERGYPFPVFQPDNLRSMIYVENVVAAVLAVLRTPPAGVATESYLVKDREDYSTRTVYSAICGELGKRPRFVVVPSFVVRFGSFISDDFRKVTGSFRVSSAKIQREIGFVPPFSLEEGIARTVAWYKRSARLRSA
jgi:nucleoside-diphosphate-sugar epimerase